MFVSRENRDHFSTLLDGAMLTDLPADRPVIVYIETGKAPTIVSAQRIRSEIQAYASRIASLGIVERSLVVIAHTQNLESIYLFWGAMAAGVIPSMFPTLTEKLDPDRYFESMRELVRLSQVQAIFTTSSFARDLKNKVGCPVYDSTALAGVAAEADLLPTRKSSPNPHEIAFLQHSSGSTGLQKGVALSHAAVLNQLAAYSDAIDLDEQDVVVSWLPLYHDMGLIAGFILPIVQGIPLILMSPFDWVRHPALLFRAINDYQGTLCWQPNFAYNHCARRIRDRDLDGLSAASMRMFINCSEPVIKESHDLFLDRFAHLGVRPEKLGVSYAMAENTFGVSQTPAGKMPNIDVVDRKALENRRRAEPVEADDPSGIPKVSCGSAIDGTTVRVMGEDGLVLPERQVGEIAIQSDCMLTEYYRRPDLTPFIDGWYLTGDIGYLAADEIYIVGRSKDLIINAGKNIYPQDIEAIVSEIPGVVPGRAVCFGVFDPKEGTELIVIVAETGPQDAESKKTLVREIRQRVAQQSMIAVSYVNLVDSQWLIKTSSGKIARGANRDKWLAEQGTKAG